MESNNSINVDQLEHLVREMEQNAGIDVSGEPKAKQKKSISFWGYLKRSMLFVLSLPIVALSSILLFPRLSVFYSQEGLGPYSSIGLSFVVVTCIWLLFALIFTYLFTKKAKIHSIVTKFIIFGILLYTSFALLFLSNSNIKDPEIKSTYLNLHPVLRVGLTTVILADTDLIITDTGRTKEDYIKWGLSPRERSYHYVQKQTGFVHAVDIRTKGRPEWVNKSIQLTFKLMGFKTLRHVGTADHLHIALVPFSKKKN